MTALLKPMPPDALLRKPAPAPKPAVRPVLVEDAAPAQPSLMKPPAFAPRREKKEEERLDELISAFIPEEDDDEDGEDCVPTSQMPVPVCVPLYEEPRRRRSWLKR